MLAFTGNLRATMLGWRGAHPDVNLDGIEANRGALLAGLDTGEIDIAIMAGEAAHDGYQREAFWSERVMVALSSSHPLAEREIIHWTDLRSERFLLPATDPGPEIRDMLLTACRWRECSRTSECTSPVMGQFLVC